MKVGDVAERTGLTVRTLHHWDRVGLLEPVRRSEAGYRLYGATDIERLQRIVSLRELGLGLAEIRDCLDRPEYALPDVLRMHRERVRRGVAAQRRLLRRLDALIRRLDAAEGVSADDYLKTIGMTTMFERYYTQEQLDALHRRGQELGEERMRAAQEEWPRLMAEMRAEMEKGTDPASERVQELARRWQALIDAFTGGDPAIASSLANMYRSEPSMRDKAGLDPGLSEYVGRAMKAR